MKFLALLPSFIALAAAVPLTKRDDPTATQILQYALTLEHLEDTFYSQALGQFDEAAFEAAGFPSWVRGRFAQIGQHEAAHVAFLTEALGNDAVAACEYSFPYTDPASFAALSTVLEGVGTSAYLGAAQFLPDPAVLTAAGAILTTEARHAAWVNSAALLEQPWSGALDTPLNQNQVFSLAASFITSCPSTNAQLPFTAFPTLAVADANGKETPCPGSTVTLDYETDSTDPTYLALFTGLDTLFAPIDGNKQATLPEGLQGTVYAVVTTNGTAVSDESTLAGPAILVFNFGADETNP